MIVDKSKKSKAKSKVKSGAPVIGKRPDMKTSGHSFSSFLGPSSSSKNDHENAIAKPNQLNQSATASSGQLQASTKFIRTKGEANDANDEENIVIDMEDEDEEDNVDDDHYDHSKSVRASAGHGRGPIQQHDMGADDADHPAPHQYQYGHTKNDNQNNINITPTTIYGKQPNHRPNQRPINGNDHELLNGSLHFNAGDLIWFDPNQLGYSIPGKVLDFYPDLTVLTVEGCGQPLALEDSQLDDATRNRLLVKADEQLQVYELSDSQAFKTIKPRQPISDDLGVPNLIDLDELSLEAIIWNVKLRQRQDVIYTKSGEKILICLNPYKNLTNIYDLNQVNKYDTIQASKLSALYQCSTSSTDANQLAPSSLGDGHEDHQASKQSAIKGLPSAPYTSICSSTLPSCPPSAAASRGSLIRWLLISEATRTTISAHQQNCLGEQKLDCNESSQAASKPDDRPHKLTPNHGRNPSRRPPITSNNQPPPPHIFNIANEALKKLLISCQDQCFLLLGDSGSGKTESCKLLLQYYASVNKSRSNLMTEQILESIQVLESFGNAKTILNDNSSRFGKLIELRFNLTTGLIMDARTVDLNLLDRSRIVCQNDNERNFNIFYEFLAGLSRNEKEKYGLQTAEKYFYLNQGKCCHLRPQEKDDGEDFRALLASLQVLGFNYEEQDTIFRILATILHLGNIYFHRKVLAICSGKLAQQQLADDDGDARSDGKACHSSNGAKPATSSAGIEGVEVGSDTEVRWVSHLLQVQFDLVMRCLTVRTTETGPSGQSSDCIVTPLNIDQALDTRDAIARALYTCLFKWLVQRINVMINGPPADTSGESNVNQPAQGDSLAGEQAQHCKSSSSTLVSSSNTHHTNADPYHQADQGHLREPIYMCRTSESLCEFQPDKMNSKLDGDSRRRRLAAGGAIHELSRNAQANCNHLSSATISILDAFGFENLSENNFEQLCINYTAELLSYHTTRYLSRLEQLEYAREQLIWRPLDGLSGPLLTGDNSLTINGSQANQEAQQHLQYSSSSLTSGASLNPDGAHATTLTSTTNTGTSNAASAASRGRGPGAIVNLISRKPLGILALLDDECNFPKATDQSFAEKCHHNHALNENYQCARLAANCQEFGIRHFKQANRMVWYQVEGFVEKNRDSLRPDVVELLVGSRMSIVADMLRKMHRSAADSNGHLGTMGSSGSSKTLIRTYDGRYVAMKPRATTVATKFQDTLNHNRVIETLTTGGAQLLVGPAHQHQRHPNNSMNRHESAQQLVAASNYHMKPASVWFIIHLKPNRSKTPQVFDVAYVQEQARSLNLLELVQMRRFGYPVRLRYSDFIRRYKCLVPMEFLNKQLTANLVDSNSEANNNNNNDCSASKAKCSSRALLKRLTKSDKNNNSNQMPSRNAIKQVCCAILDYNFENDPHGDGRDAPVPANYQCGTSKLFLNERFFHQLEELRLEVYASAIELMQKTIRMWLARRNFLMRRQAAIVIQANYRAHLAQQLFRRQYMLIVNLQLRWRQVLESRRQSRAQKRRQALKEEQQLRLNEILAQQRKQSNQFRFRLTHNSQQQQQAGNTNYGSMLEIPEDLTQLYRLQRQWVPVHDLSHLSEVDLTEMMDREQKRRAKHGDNNYQSVPFIALANEQLGREKTSSRNNHAHPGDCNHDQLVADYLDRLELDDRYLLHNFLLKYFTVEVAQFGYSRLPITRPFNWPQLVRLMRLELRRQLEANSAACDNQISQQELMDHIEPPVRRRFDQVEQKSIAIYKLILRYIDSDQQLTTKQQDETMSSTNSSVSATGNYGYLRTGGQDDDSSNSCNNRNSATSSAFQKVQKFKLISDYINYLCLTEPLLRDEVYLQLCSLSWQNPRLRSTENSWKLFANCLDCFGPQSGQLGKFLLKFANDYCCDKYRRLICSKLWRHLQPPRQEPMRSGSKHRNTAMSKLVCDLGQQRRYPTTVLEYWANHEAIDRLTISASCYMDDHALNESVGCESSPEELQTVTNFSNKMLAHIDSFTRAEQLASQVLESRQVAEKNRFGWSVEIQHEGAQNEFSSRLRGDDFLLDHFARLELLPELVQLIDDELETLEELENDNYTAPVDTEGHHGVAADRLAGQPDGAAHMTPSEFSQRHEVRRSSMISSGHNNRFSLMSSRMSWDNSACQLQLGGAPLRASSVRDHSRRHSTAMSDSSRLGPPVTSGHWMQPDIYQPAHVGHGDHENHYVGMLNDHHHQQRFAGHNQRQYQVAGGPQLDRRLYRRSMSMQELQLAATSALNGRYFGGQSAVSPSNYHHQAQGHNYNQHQLCPAPSGSPFAAPGHAMSDRYRQSPASAGSSGSHRRQHGRQSGSLSRRQEALAMQCCNEAGSPRRRSVTPTNNSALGTGSDYSPARQHNASSSHQPHRLSSSNGHYGHGRWNDQPIPAAFPDQQQHLQMQHQTARSTGSRRSGSTLSSRCQPNGPTSDYASIHSEYERVGGPIGDSRPSGQSRPKHQAGSDKPPSIGSSPKQLKGSARQFQQQQQHQHKRKATAPISNASSSQVTGHYATSSAMSDTSEAPSLASHVRAVKVPQPNGDLDRYLDDLFNPLLGEADLDELSDARSLATSIRGRSDAAQGVGLQLLDSVMEHRPGFLADPLELCRRIRGMDQLEGDAQVEQPGQTVEVHGAPEVGVEREQQLSPTFELLLESLRPAGGDPIVGQSGLTMGETSRMSLSELKALNERLETQIQAAQSARPALGLMSDTMGELPLLSSQPTGYPSQQTGPAPPPPPPQPSFRAPGGSEGVNSREKTIRIGRWRWPPAREQLEPGAQEQVDEQAVFQQMVGGAGERKRASLMDVAADREHPLKLTPLEPPSSLSSGASRSSELEPQANVQAAQAVGRLKISSEMKAKLEQLTNSSGQTGGAAVSPGAPNGSSSTSLVSQAKASLLQETGELAEGGSPRKLAANRRNLLELQLLGCSGGGSDGPPAPPAADHQPQVVVGPGAGSKVLAAKQQLAAAAGVALASLDDKSAASSQASSRRQSANVGPARVVSMSRPQTGEHEDELGPRSKAAISQRRAFYQVSGSSSADHHQQFEYSYASLSVAAAPDASAQAGPDERPQTGPEQPKVPPPPPAMSLHRQPDETAPAQPEPDTARQSRLTLDHGADYDDEAHPDNTDRDESRQRQNRPMIEHLKPTLGRLTRSTPIASNLNEAGKQQWVATSEPRQQSAGPTKTGQRLPAPAGKASKRLPSALPGHQAPLGHLGSAKSVARPGRFATKLLQPPPESSADRGPADKLVALVHSNVDWQLRVRKELFLPSETYDDEPLVMQLIFAQLVADVFNPRHWTRLNNKERAAIKSMMKDNSIGYSPSLPPIGHLEPIKRDLIRMARSFGLYFARPYRAQNYARQLTEGQVAGQLVLQSGARGAGRGQARSDDSSANTSDESSCSSDADVGGPTTGAQGSALVGESPESGWAESSRALKLAQRLHSAGALGLDWLDMVAVHHSGLRLVTMLLDEASVPAKQAKQELNRRHSLASSAEPIGYKVLETLKFRDMASVLQISHRLLLIAMRNGKQSWLISSSQTNQLAPLLKSFHSDYIEHLNKPPTTALQSRADPPQQQSANKRLQRRANRHSPSQAAKPGLQTARGQDALLASNDGDHGDHLKQRQAPNCIGKLRPEADANDALANGGGNLPNSLANSSGSTAASPERAHHQQHHHHHGDTAGQQTGATGGRHGRKSSPTDLPSPGPAEPRGSAPGACECARSGGDPGVGGCGCRLGGQPTAAPQPAAGAGSPTKTGQQLDASAPPCAAKTKLTGSPASEAGAPPAASELAASHEGQLHETGAQGAGDKSKRSKSAGGGSQAGSLWQNSLSRMSSKLSLFAGSSRRKSAGDKKSGSKTATKTHPSSHTCDTEAGAEAPAGQDNQPAGDLEAWIETKVDFDEDDDDDELDTNVARTADSNNNNNNIQREDHMADPDECRLESALATGHDQVNAIHGEPSPAADSAGCHVDQRKSKPCNASSNGSPAKGAGQPGQTPVKDDGKYSMLQFALHNFREALEKYSLDSKATTGKQKLQQLAPQPPGHDGNPTTTADARTTGLTGSSSSTTTTTTTTNNNNNNHQDGAQWPDEPDTSTLRGSLKFIETLRNVATNKQTQQVSGSPGTLRSTAKLQDWTWRELAEMVKFSQVPIKRPLLKLASQDLERKALECFAAIMRYMGDLGPTAAPSNAKHLHQHHQQAQHQRATNEVECVYLVLINCHNYPQLRDEVYCQLMKQTTNNRSERPDSCLRGWRLFSMVAAYFECSAQLRPYLVKYLENAAYDKRRAYHSVALLCLQNLRKTFKFKGRKNVPSIEEITATSAGRNSKRQIYRLPGGTERVINTNSTTVVEDIIHEICSSMLNVCNQDEMLEYSLYCIADGDLYTMPLNRDEYILDITTELVKNHQQYFLIFCRSIWHHPLRLDSKLYIEVIFNQIAPDYLEGLLLVLPASEDSGGPTQPVEGARRARRRHHQQLADGGSSPMEPAVGHFSGATSQSSAGSTISSSNSSNSQPRVGANRLKNKLVKEIARIAALLHRASGSDYIPHKDEIKYLLPKPIVASIKREQQRLMASNQQSAGNGKTISASQKWVELVQENCREMSAFDALDAKAQFLDIVRHWPLFGSSFFAIKLIQRDLIQPMDYILALNKLGIQMLDPITHETIHKYPFNEVVSTRKVRSEDGALFLDMKCGNLMKRTIIRIQTDQAHEISRLIRQYIDIELLQANKI